MVAAEQRQSRLDRVHHKAFVLGFVVIEGDAFLPRHRDDDRIRVLTDDEGADVLAIRPGSKHLVSACASWNRGDRRGSSIPCEGNASSAPWTKVAGSTIPALEVGEATTSGRWLPPPPVSTVVVPLSCLPRPMTPESRDREPPPGSRSLRSAAFGSTTRACAEPRPVRGLSLLVDGGRGGS